MIEQKLEEKLDEILTEENIKALDLFTKNLKIITKVLGQCITLNEKEKGITKTRLAEEIGLSIREADFIPIQVADNLTGMYLLSELSKEKFAEKLVNYNAIFTGTQLRKETWARCIYKEYGKTKILYPIALSVKDQKHKFLLMFSPQDNRVATTIWIVCNKKDSEAICDILDEYRDKYNLFRNKVILCTGDGYEIINLHEKFTLEEIVLTDAVKQECEFIRNMFVNYKNYTGNIIFKRGILFSGIPGVGKTTAVNALMKEAIKSNGTCFVLTSNRQQDIHQIYAVADKFSPALVILEDFDLIAQNREQGNGITSLLLNILDGTTKFTNVITIATTNRKEDLDVAAIRAGRIDKTYAFDYPNYKMKLALLDIHLHYYNVNIDRNILIKNKAVKEFLESDITGAMIASIILGAQQKAISNNSIASVKDIEFMIEGTKFKKMTDNIL